MAYDAYGDADIFSFSLFCLGGILTAHVLGGFLNYFMQMRFVITTVIAQVVLTTSMFAILLATEAETTGASQTPREVDWRLIPATVLLLFAVLILTALALACFNTNGTFTNTYCMLWRSVSGLDVGLAFLGEITGWNIVGIIFLYYYTQLAKLLVG